MCNQRTTVGIISALDIEFKTQESKTFGTSYTIVVKCANDRMCELYKSIKRCDITKACYDVVVVKADWMYGGKTGVRLDAYLLRTLEPVIRVNEVLERMWGVSDVVEDEVIAVKEKKIVVNHK